MRANSSKYCDKLNRLNTASTAPSASAKVDLARYQFHKQRSGHDWQDENENDGFAQARLKKSGGNEPCNRVPLFFWAPGRLLLLLLVSAFLSVSKPAYSQGFGFITNDNTITITGYGGPEEDLVIPEVIEGLPVTGIANFAFMCSMTLTRVSIPMSVTNIGYEAFWECYYLAAIDVAAGNSNYCSLDGVLFNKDKTTLIKYPPLRKAGSYSVPDPVIVIEDDAFSRCGSLTNIAFPDGVRSIGDHSFYSCEGLTNVVLPKNLTNIATYAFFSCSYLMDITIPENVLNIGEHAFSHCYCLDSITVSVSNQVYSSVYGVLFDQKQTALIKCPEGKNGSFVAPSGTARINSASFWNSSLRSVTLPAALASIGDAAFSTCGNLESVFFLGNAPDMGDDAFFNTHSAIIYYLPGTTGWSDTFSGLPALLWKPHVEVGIVRFGLRTNQMGFSVFWASGREIVLETSTNLFSPIWYPIQTNTLVEGVLYFYHDQWTNSPGRFFRICAPEFLRANDQGAIPQKLLGL